MSFDQQPDGDPHGECAAEIARLAAELADWKRMRNEAMAAATSNRERIRELEEELSGAEGALARCATAWGAETKLRQTAEVYAAKNALLVIELTQANVDVADINVDLLVRSRELEDALREIETLGLAHKDPYVPGETFAKIAAAALRPPGTPAAPACGLCAEGVPLAQVGDVKIHIDSHGTRYCATSKKPAVKP